MDNYLLITSREGRLSDCLAHVSICTHVCTWKIVGISWTLLTVYFFRDLANRCSQNWSDSWPCGLYTDISIKVFFHLLFILSHSFFSYSYYIASFPSSQLSQLQFLHILKVGAMWLTKLREAAYIKLSVFVWSIFCNTLQV